MAADHVSVDFAAVQRIVQARLAAVTEVTMVMWGEPTPESQEESWGRPTLLEVEGQPRNRTADETHIVTVRGTVKVRVAPSQEAHNTLGIGTALQAVVDALEDQTVTEVGAGGMQLDVQKCTARILPPDDEAPQMVVGEVEFEGTGTRPSGTSREDRLA